MDFIFDLLDVIFSGGRFVIALLDYLRKTLDILWTAKAGGFRYHQLMPQKNSRSYKVSFDGRCPAHFLLQTFYRSRRILPLPNFQADFNQNLYSLQSIFAAYIPTPKGGGFTPLFR